jgi:5'-3' exonuclease
LHRSNTMTDFCNELINLIHKFQRDGIQLIWVIDGKPRIEKNYVIEHRRNFREKINKKIEDIIENVVDNTTKIDDEYEHIIALSKKARSMRQEHVEMAKRIFDIMGVHYVHIENMEADAILKYLLDYHIADIVFSADMDLLAYGCSRIIQNLDFRNDIITEINYEDLLSALRVSGEQLLSAMILSGTDYNNSLKHSKFGDNLEFIKKYGSISKVLENLDEINLDIPEGKKITIPKRFDWQVSMDIFKEVLSPNIIKDIKCILEKQKSTHARLTVKMFEDFYKMILDNDTTPNKKYGRKVQDYLYWKFNYKAHPVYSSLPKTEAKPNYSSVKRKLFN